MYIQNRLLEEELRKITLYRQRLKELYNEKYLIEPLERYKTRIEIFICLVEQALEELSPLHKEFFYLYYEKKQNIEKICIEMSLSQYTVERLRLDILGKVSEKFGLLKD